MVYNSLKKIFPKDFLIKNEVFFRKFIYIFYLGNQHQCPVCNRKFRKFILNQRGEKLCPSCGSMPRDRRLFTEFKKEFDGQRNVKLLDFSPSRSLYRRLKKISQIQYFPTDLSTDFISEYQYDISKIPVEDHFFDFIFCYHILEHIDQDSVAMRELKRVLKPEGRIFVQTPFKQGEIYENPNVKTKAERLLHFGQEDHVRIYSVAGLKKRLQDVGFQVDVKVYDKDDYFGLTQDETILFLNQA